MFQEQIHKNFCHFLKGNFTAPFFVFIKHCNHCLLNTVPTDSEGRMRSPWLLESCRIQCASVSQKSLDIVVFPGSVQRCRNPSRAGVCFFFFSFSSPHSHTLWAEELLDPPLGYHQVHETRSRHFGITLRLLLFRLL